MDYARLIDKIRICRQEEDSLDDAVERAIQECIQENVLADYLRLNQSEVRDLILSEYDEQQHIENEKKWSWEEGKAEGKEEGREEGIGMSNTLTKLLLQENRMEDLKKSLEDKAFQIELMKQYGLIEQE